MLDCLPIVQDDVRKEDEEAQAKIQAELVAVYKALPFPMVYVPVMEPYERVEFILNNL